MKKILFTLLVCLMASYSFADSIFMDGFEFSNHDGESPCGWVCDDQSWLCGYLEKDHNRKPHSDNWYAYTDAQESWMFMPIYMNTQLKYRFSCWVISDGAYELEFWAGNEADPAQMSQLLLSASVNSGTYEKVSEYIQQIADNFQYFGIKAVASEGAYRLTIDDINVDMVEKYSFTATPTESHTTLYPGEQAVHKFKIQNTGYEPIDVLLIPIHEFFPEVLFFVDDTQCTTWHIEPDEIVSVTTQATLSPDVLPGTTCWLDIMLELDCSCASAMTTLWVDVMNPQSIAEFEQETDVQQTEVYDLTGKRVDPANLKAGIYIERTITAQGVTTRKFVKR
ncbi:MAG: T9SS type A sorting domain-containing protein [Bacteroidales bacterium]|nr:T9SS type A sorting domain-containing protein [Bacteroidales bacterium]